MTGAHGAVYSQMLARCGGVEHCKGPVQNCCTVDPVAGLNMAVFLLIGKTSALTMNIAGVVKDWLLIGLSYVMYRWAREMPKRRAGTC